MTTPANASGRRRMPAQTRAETACLAAPFAEESSIEDGCLPGSSPAALLTDAASDDPEESYSTRRSPDSHAKPLAMDRLQPSAPCYSYFRLGPMLAVCCTALVMLYLLLPGDYWQPNSPMLVEVERFITVNGLQFELDCQPFLVAGFNAHDLIPKVLVQGNQDGHLPSGAVRNLTRGAEAVRRLFQQAAALKLNVVRTYVHTTLDAFPVQEGPGQYDEPALQALDIIIEEARQAGLHVILSFMDNWKYPGGVDQYVDWSRTAAPRTHNRPPDEQGDPNPEAWDPAVRAYEGIRHAAFFNDSGCKAMYRQHVMHILTRRSLASGRLYRHDPTILAFNLLNELRCETQLVPECPQLVNAWVQEMAAFVKSIDRRHLLAVGAEGFFGPSSPYRAGNPGDWAADMGQDFVDLHTPPEIDLATTHVWPANWKQ